MDKDRVIVWVAVCTMVALLGIAHECNKGAPTGDEWQKMKNVVERLDENVDRLNEKCGVDPTKAKRK